jgi:hypothetical protein
VGEVEASRNPKSKLLKEANLEFNANRDILISYYNNGKVNSYD